MRILLIDNYDSHTYNLFQLFAETTGEAPLVVHNDTTGRPWAKDRFDAVVISPGPGRPDAQSDFGICADVLGEAGLPTLGVCLGHQGLGALYGAEIRAAPEVMHGRLSAIHHVGSGLFHGIPQECQVVRYHSLVVAPQAAPDLEQLAWTNDGLCMALKHRTLPLWGVQFHPESILTPDGARLIQNFVALAEAARGRNTPHRGPSNSIGAAPKDSAPRALSDERPRLRLHHATAATWCEPETVFQALYVNSTHSFWLDSAQCASGRARFSYTGAFPGGPLSELLCYHVGRDLLVRQADGACRRAKHDLLSYLDDRLMSARSPDVASLAFNFHGGWVGYLGYEVKGDCGAKVPFRSELPDAYFQFADRFVAFDHLRSEVTIVSLFSEGDAEQAERWLKRTTTEIEELAQHNGRSGSTERMSADKASLRTAPSYTLARDFGRYMRDIETCKRELTAGDTYEVCLTNSLSCAPLDDALTTYRRLRRLNAAPYAAFLRFDDLALLSSSPERFLHIDAERNVETKPIKGTSPRGKTPVEDHKLREALGHSSKDHAENLMIVDLLRNDLGRVCEIGSIHVPSLMAIESYESVHQMVSTVRGRLRSDITAVECIRAAFPGGSMTGAPKLRTMEIIDELEGRARGPYSGAIGYFSVSGAADWNIVIRTIISTPARVTIGAGGAIVAASEPEAEFEEMLLKAQAVLPALAISDGQRSPIRHGMQQSRVQAPDVVALAQTATSAKG
jgi:para-aminobenzoate synthetase